MARAGVASRAAERRKTYQRRNRDIKKPRKKMNPYFCSLLIEGEKCNGK
jgi:hypothetical protein